MWIGGKEVRFGDTSWLKDKVGVVDQGASLFSGTIEENIAYGKVNFSPLQAS